MLVMRLARRQLHPELRVAGAAVVFADGQTKIAHIPALGGVEFERLHVGDVEQNAFGQCRRAWHIEISLGDMAAKLISGIRHTFSAHVKTDDETILVLGFVMEKMRRTGRHQPAMAGANLGALITLTDDAVTVDVNRNFIASAVQMLGVRGAGTENRMKNGGCTAVRAGYRQTKLRDCPAVTFLHVFGDDVGDVDEIGL